MIVVDTSAIVALAFGEPERDIFARANRHGQRLGLTATREIRRIAGMVSMP